MTEEQEIEIQLFSAVKAGPYLVVPMQMIDKLMAELSGNEFKVLMFIYRKTIGWQKDMDRISFNQIHTATGIKSKDTVRSALDGLIDEGLILRNRYSRREISEYRLNIDYSIKVRVRQRED